MIAWHTRGGIAEGSVHQNYFVMEVYLYPSWYPLHNTNASLLRETLAVLPAIRKGQEVQSMEGHENYVFCVNFNNPQANLLVR